MAQSKTSKQWLKEHFDDEYVRKSQEDGLRSRASYKLLEIQEKDKLIERGMTVVDLGAAPGGWSQVAADLVGDKGRVIASGMLPEGGADLVMSDMAPNMSGMRDIDQPRMMYLAELALDLARSVLRPGAYFLVKVFHGEGLREFEAQLKADFASIKVRKPKASRARSSEVYLLAAGFKGV